jgi:hypothetical protein
MSDTRFEAKELSGSAATLLPDYDNHARPVAVPAGQDTPTVRDDEFFEVKSFIEGSDGGPSEFIKRKR